MPTDAPVKLSFLAPIAVMGLPLSPGPGQPPSGRPQARLAARGGKACFEWAFQYGAVAVLADRMPDSAPTRGDSEYGDYAFTTSVKTSEGKTIQVELRSSSAMLDAVVKGTEEPTPYEHDGRTYNIVGSIEHTIAFDGVSAWSVTMPLMLLSSVPAGFLSKVAYKSFLKPIISRMYKGIRKALRTEVTESFDALALEAAADVAAAEATLAEEVVAEAAVDATLSLETGGLALIGVVALIALQIAAGLLFHPSYHGLLIYNFTQYALEWEPPYLNEGKITLEPVTDTTGDTPLRTLPPVSKSSPSKFIAPVNTASMAEWNLYSDSKVHGVKWGMAFTARDAASGAALAQLAAMWDVPLDKSNAIGLARNISQGKLSDWVKDKDDKHETTSRQITFPVGSSRIVVSNSIDYLHDKHPMSPDSDDKGYIYRSVLVFEQLDAEDLALCAVANADGRLEVFTLGADQQIHHTWQAKPGGDWKDWVHVGTEQDPIRRLAVGQNADGRLEAFGIDPEGSVHHTWQSEPNGSWKAWSRLGTGSEQARELAVGRNLDGRMELFIACEDGGVRCAHQTTPNGSWSAWARLGAEGALQARSVAVGRNADGRLQVFALGKDDGIHHCWQSAPGGPWKDWTRLGAEGSKGRSLAVGQNADGRLEVFVVGMNDGVYHAWQTTPGGDWKAWSRLGTEADKARRLAVGANADGRIEVFAVGMNDGIYHCWQSTPNGGWKAWARLGKDSNEAIALAVASNRDGRMELVTLGTNCKPYHYAQTTPNGSWGSESELG